MAIEPETSEKLKDLMLTLGHGFRDIKVLKLALTHSSLIGENKHSYSSNERLEFLGDRILGLIIAELLVNLFPNENEGDLSRRHAELVRMETLGKVANSLQLGTFVFMAKGEERMGGRENSSLLADVCEAVIAALYIDGGLETASNFIEDNWQPFLKLNPIPPKDAKTILQEWAQKRGLPLPDYREIRRSGPAHQPNFTIAVTVVGEKQFSGSGQSKRAAEQKAAENMLKRISCD